MIGGAASLDVRRSRRRRRTARGRGRLIAVAGRGGTGASTVAMALAQGLADDDLYAGQTLLADLRLDADLAMLHDARDVVPGLQELVDAHRHGQPDRRRGPAPHLRGRQPPLPAPARAAAPPRLDGPPTPLARRGDSPVCGAPSGSWSPTSTPTSRGKPRPGRSRSRSATSSPRTTVAHADVVVAVGLPGVKGLHALVRVVDDLRGHGVDPPAHPRGDQPRRAQPPGEGRAQPHLRGVERRARIAAPASPDRCSSRSGGAWTTCTATAHGCPPRSPVRWSARCGRSSTAPRPRPPPTGRGAGAGDAREPRVLVRRGGRVTSPRPARDADVSPARGDRAVRPRTREVGVGRHGRSGRSRAAARAHRRRGQAGGPSTTSGASAPSTSPTLPSSSSGPTATSAATGRSNRCWPTTTCGRS